MRADDPLAAEPLITPQHLTDRPVVAITGDHTVDRQLTQIMAEVDARLIHNSSSYFYAIARQLVASGDSLAIVDPANGKAGLGDGVIWRPFEPPIYHELVLITSRDHPLGLMGERMLSQIRDGLEAVRQS
jgi:hypothetical protein